MVADSDGVNLSHWNRLKSSLYTWRRMVASAKHCRDQNHLCIGPVCLMSTSCLPCWACPNVDCMPHFPQAKIIIYLIICILYTDYNVYYLYIQYTYTHAYVPIYVMLCTCYLSRFPNILCSTDRISVHLLSLDFDLTKVLFISNAKIDLNIHTPNNFWTMISEYNTQFKVIISKPRFYNLAKDNRAKKAIIFAFACIKFFLL